MRCSPNRDADAGAPGPLDWALALALHALLVAAWAASWHAAPPPLVPAAVKVRLVAPAPQPARTRPMPRKPARAARPPQPARVVPKPGAKPKKKAEEIPPETPLVAPLAGAATPAAGPREAPLAARISGGGAAGVLSRQEVARYLARMRARIESAWRPPPGPFERDPEIELRLFPDGRIRSVRILVSSGNPALDASLVRAVQAAAPFALPPEGYEAFLTNRIRFHPRR